MEKVPIINCSNIIGSFSKISQQALGNFAHEFGGAISKTGFVYLVNHGVDMRKVEKVYELSRTFFALPAETKRKYHKNEPLQNFNGYSGPGEEFLNNNEPNTVEEKELWDVWGEDGYNPAKFPSEVPGFQQAFEEFRSDCVNLTWKILRAIGIYLELEDKEHLFQYHRALVDQSVKTQTQIRSLYYFPLEEGSSRGKNSIRCGAHSDWGTITLLFQDKIGGLEMQSTAGEWIPLVPMENSILINIGQLLELWSGGRLYASVHRVRILEEESLLKIPRQSLIYFLDPDGETKVEPILPVLPGKEYLTKRGPLVAYDHSQGLIEKSLQY